MVGAVLAAHVAIRELPDRRLRRPSTISLGYKPITLPAAPGPLQLVGAWVLEADDSRLGGLSALAIHGNRFLAVTDRGAVLSFDPPGVSQPSVRLSDLRVGPGPFAKKRGRDAESLARDPKGRGWWVGYEQRHSLWLYDDLFGRGVASINLERSDWRDNRGAEGLIALADGLLVLPENGREAIRMSTSEVARLPLEAGADIADAARAPDGSDWVLLREMGPTGIKQSIVPLIRTETGFRTGPAWAVPKGMFDNYEGMAIAPLAGGGWRFWLVTDDGHRIMARTLLVAFDYFPPAGHDKSPATSAGPSKDSTGKAP